MLAMEDNISVVTTGVRIAWFGFVAEEVVATVVIIAVGEEWVEG